MYTQAVITFGLATLASAHMKMSSPVPYGASSLDNSPLDPSGSDFPCKQRSGVYTLDGASNVYAQGATGDLAFIGSAVHGGGSCQVSITYDAQPDKNSVWKVIKSIEGGCPAKNAAGNLGDNANQQNKDTYNFQIPEDMPAGNGTIAWTWFNKVGNREMYMNCGPVTITGSEGSQSAFEALPNMFVANLKSVNDCVVPEGTDVQFPNAGKSVDVFGTALGGPKGSCGSSGGGGGSGGGNTGSPAPSNTAGNGAGQPSAAPTTASSSTPTSTPLVSQPSQSKPTGGASLPGGVFLTKPGNASPSPTATASASQAPIATPSAAPSSGSGSGNGTGGGSGSGSGSGSGGGGGAAGAQTVGAACTDEGAWNCVGGSSFQRCASGAWSAVQQLASGTSCTAGMGSSISMVVVRNGRKRALRFRSSA
ncbi:hypothetical protein CTRI78_v005029 [Colletotrichum trifolii]|uniref:Uncharacterized protein n=1 Tax=Colletotrichum trifolii TaxID=5466 RepID=A0A4R8RFR4_COLTR|nr:hypothetical protein CTRI78_v005029 [Colletotrichum trifolii]